MDRIDWKARGREAKLLLLHLVALLAVIFIFSRVMDARLAAHERRVEREVLARVDSRNLALTDALLLTLRQHQERYDWLLNQCVAPCDSEQWVLMPGVAGAELPR